MRGDIVENSIDKDSEDASKVPIYYLIQNEMCLLNYSPTQSSVRLQ